MGRKKATMNLIGSQSIRCTTLKKRRSSLLKKASELTKLCGQPVCLVVSDGPDNSSAVVWPSHEEAAQTLSMANSMPEGKQKKEKKLVREVAEIQEQVQNQDQENLHLEALLQMHLKEALGRIDTQLTITPLSSAVQPPILEDGEHLPRILMPIDEEGMLWGYDNMPGSFDPFGLPSISMPALLDIPNFASSGGEIIQTQSLNEGAACACACGGEEKESMLWDGEHQLEPIFEEDWLPDDGEALTPVLDKYKLMDFLDMYEPEKMPEQHIVDPGKMPGYMSDEPMSQKESSLPSWDLLQSDAAQAVSEGPVVHSLDDDCDAVLSSFFRNFS